MKTDSYYYNEEACRDFPSDKFSKFLFESLNVLEESILIVNRDTTVCYINQSYIKTFGKRIQEVGFSRSLNAPWKLTDVGSPQDSQEILDLLNGRTFTPKYYSPINYSDIRTFVDLIPLRDEDTIYGAALVIRNTTEIDRMSSELNHYRSLAKSLHQEILAKDNLPFEFRQIIGSSQEFISLLNTAARVSKSEASVYLFGESGTGKEVLAKAIHYNSQRSKGPLIKINCAAIPENLMESELFGYENGAFTGAKSSGMPGKFELANGGTLFLDEIGDMPLSMQVKLLRALQEHEITRIGGTKTIKLNFRLITATNKNLEEMIQNGTFREDLYYRINVIPLNIPALRDRKGDIPVLAEYFLKRLNEQYNEEKYFSEETLAQFCCYSWPGNIRELKNVVERMSILSTTSQISTEWMPSQIRNSKTFDFPEARHMDYNLQKILEDTERETIRAVLNIANGNRSQAIKMLGISRRSFYMKLEKYNIK